MAYLLKFGNYTFPLTLLPAGESSAQDLATQQRPRAPGGITQDGRREKTLLSIRGQLKGDTLADLTAKHQALKAAIYAGKQKLYFGLDDRYYKDAQIGPFGTDYSGGHFFGLLANYTMSFEAADYPSSFATALTTQALSTGAGGTVAYSPLGDSVALPTWSLTLGSAPSGGGATIALDNLRTGESTRLDVTALSSADVITLNRDGYVVAVNGVVRPGILRGRIPTLLPDASVVNNLVLTAAGVTLSAASVSYYARWK